MTDLPMLADGCGDQDRLRVRMAITGESLAQASRALAHDPAPTATEIDAADRTPYDPVFFRMLAGDVEAGGGLLAARIPAATGTVHRGAWSQ